MSDTGALVYVVDDDPSAREGVARLIRSAGLMTKTFGSGEEFLAAQRPKIPSCLVLDVNLPGVNGLDLQQELEKSGSQVPIVFLTGHGDIPMAVRAVRAGAANFLTKPVDDEDLLNAITQSIAYYLEDQIRPAENMGNIVGESPALQRVLKDVQVVAPTDSTVLIQGETGTGKELVAHAIHDLSSRSKRSFVQVNCASIPATLLESELFGHEKGAFTGAFAQKIGRFERAHEGTLFLDEIGEIPLELQPKLLRALQEHEFERLGSAQTVRVNVRVVAATNQDLGQLVTRKLFRADLFYRLNVIPICLPPLRERVQDILPLTEFFVAKFAASFNKPIDLIPDEVVAVLKAHDWPGNIRELQNLIERAVLFSPGSVLRLPLDLKQMVKQSSESVTRTLAAADREHILETLKQTAWMIVGQDGAANRLGLPRTTLIYKMRKLGIETRRSPRARPIRRLADERCRAAASC